MKLITFFNNLRSRAGITETKNEEITEFLSKLSGDELSVEVPDVLANLLERNLLSMEDAKNNKDIKKHFESATRGLIYNKIDDQIKSAFKQIELPKEEVEKFFQDNDDIFTKVDAAIALIKTKSAASPNGDKNDNERIKELTEQLKQKQSTIDNYVAEMKKKDSDFEQKLKEIESGFKQKETRDKLLSKINSIELATEYDQDVQEALRDKVFRKIQESYRIIPDEKGELVPMDLKEDVQATHPETKKTLSLGEILDLELGKYRKKNEKAEDSTRTRTRTEVVAKTISGADKNAQRLKALED